MYVIFDVETTGLPRNNSYETARCVSIAWQVLDSKYEVIKEANFIINPEGFIIPSVVVMIHGIDTNTAKRIGCAFDIVINDFMTDVKNASLLVAHNISFDYNVILFELVHRGFFEYAKVLKTVTQFCTMRIARSNLRLKKNPKLKELYTILYESMTSNEHNARYDTKFCSLCFAKLHQSI